MKKILRLILCLFTALNLLACPGEANKGGSDTESIKDSTSSKGEPGTTSPPTSTDPLTDGTSTSGVEETSATSTTHQSSSSTSETNSTSGGPSLLCGNKMVEDGEGCDDGNDLAGDGCSGCKVEKPCLDWAENSRANKNPCLHCLNQVGACCVMFSQCMLKETVGMSCVEYLECVEAGEAASCQSQTGQEGWINLLERWTCLKSNPNVCMELCGLDQDIP